MTRTPVSSTTRACSDPHAQRVHTVNPPGVRCRDTTWNGVASGHPQYGHRVFTPQRWPAPPYMSRLTLWTVP